MPADGEVLLAVVSSGVQRVLGGHELELLDIGVQEGVVQVARGAVVAGELLGDLHPAALVVVAAHEAGVERIERPRSDLQRIRKPHAGHVQPVLTGRLEPGEVQLVDDLPDELVVDAARFDRAGEGDLPGLIQQVELLGRELHAARLADVLPEVGVLGEARQVAELVDADVVAGLPPVVEYDRRKDRDLPAQVADLHLVALAVLHGRGELQEDARCLDQQVLPQRDADRPRP